MQAPESPFVRLCFDASKHGWIAYHELTGETQALPVGSGAWSKHEDDDGSVFFRQGENMMWAGQCFHMVVLQDDEGSYFVLHGSDSENVEPLQDYQQCHKEDELQLPVSGGSTSLKLWRFQRPWSGSHFFWSLYSLRNSTAGESSMTPSQWLESWWPWWTKFLGRLQIACPEHLRKASPKRNVREVPCPKTKLLFRVLPHPTASTFALLALMMRMSSKTTVGRSVRKDEKARLAMQSVLVGYFDLLLFREKVVWEAVVFMDQQATCTAGLPSQGQNPQILRITPTCMVELGSLSSWGEWGESLLVELGISDEIHLIEFCNIVVHAGAKYLFLFAQLVHQLASRIEQNLLSALPRQSVTDSSGRASDNCVSAVEAPESTKSQIPKRLASLGKFAQTSLVDAPKKVKLKYYFATRRNFANGQFISISMDATRLRRQGFLLAVIAKPGNVAAWLPPQVRIKFTQTI